MAGDPRQPFNFPTTDPATPEESSGTDGTLNFPAVPVQQQPDQQFNFPTSGNPGHGAHLELDLDPSAGGLFKVVDGTGQTIDQKAPDGILGHAVDVLSRGQFGSTAFIDALFSGDGGPAAIGRAFGSAISEFISPQKRLSYEDLLKTNSPAWAAAHPMATNLLGFVGDVALDPVTYLTFGTGASTKVVGTGGRMITVGQKTIKVGEKAIPLSRQGKRIFKQIVDKQQLRGLTGPALRESSTKVLSRMASSEKWGDVIKDAGGVKLFGVNPITNKGQAAVNKLVRETLGLERLGQAVRNLPGVQTLRRTFQRNADLPQEYIDTRRHIESEMIAIDSEVRDEVLGSFARLSKTQRKNVGRVSAQIDDATRARAAELGRDLTPDEARGLRDRTLLDQGITGDEFTVFSRMHQRYQQVGELEMQAGLLERLLLNYTPRRYTAIRDAPSLSGLRRKWFRRLANTFTPTEHRQFKNMAEAVEAGYDPVLDASVLYTQRLIESRQALARKSFNDAVETIFDGADNIPPRVRQDITFIGEGVYSRGALPEANNYLRLYDSMMGLFRRSATVIRPAFGARQAVSNSLQSFAVLGAKAFGAFDPRTVADAMFLMNGKPGKFTLRSTFGHTFTGDEVLDLAKEHGMVRGISLEGIGAGTSTERLARGVARDIDRVRFTKRVAGSGKAAEGLAKFMVGLTRYTNWPAKIEDFGRLSTFMNGLRMGHSPAAAAARVNEGLFDYLHGLSALETRVARRIIPFYSFQRFAIPMIARVAASAPGRIINPLKAAETFMEAWNQIAGGQTLNESERAAVPGWLLEQPATFERLDENMKAVFRTFNNFSPLDVFSFVRTDADGNFDTEETLKRAFLAQITPIIKVPLEWAARKNFFTGRALPRDMRGARQRAGDLDADRVLAHLAGVLGAEVTGGELAGVAGGRLVGNLIGAIPGGSEAILKRAFGWEEGVDPKTGRRQVFINPFLVQTFTSLNPALSDAFRVGREDNTPLERTMQLLFGIGTTKVDLKQQREFKLERLQQERSQLVRDIRRAQREGRDESVDRKINDLNVFMEQMKDEALQLTRQDVRGE
jgi:hypothetical protein